MFNAVILLAMGIWRLSGHRWLSSGPNGDAASGLLWLFVRAYSRLMHRVTFDGVSLVPDGNAPGCLNELGR